MELVQGRGFDISMAMDASVEEKPIMALSVGMKCGCLQILDEGHEYLQSIDLQISNIKHEKEDFVKAIEDNKLVQKNWQGWDGKKPKITPAYIYKPKNFETIHESVPVDEFDKAISGLLKAKEIKHYKCKCTKCGKIRFYSADTLQTEPKVCYKPIYCSSQHTYSVRAQNATYRKREKYENNESVCLVYSRDEVIPSGEYCEKWNETRKKELLKQAEKDAKIIAEIPRKLAKNYDESFVGLKYESLEILECVNDTLESPPIPYYNQRHQKLYRDITVYKEYRCRCYLCGKEIKVTCDKFGIYPPTPYGYRAYNGYWSEIYCDCHTISSFQWIVNDILIKHGVEYLVEVSVDGVCGIDKKTPLRFDFAVYKKGQLFAFLECQGEQHYKPIDEFGGERRFSIQQRNDEEKRKYAKEKKIKLIEISYKDKKYEMVESILKLNNII